jgi:hypothetical protein
MTFNEMGTPMNCIFAGPFYHLRYTRKGPAGRPRNRVAGAWGRLVQWWCLAST